MKRDRAKSQKKRGLKYYRKKKYKKAVYFLEEALRSKKDDPQIYLYLGYSSLRLGDNDGARHYFKSGLITNEGDVDLMKGLAYVYLKDDRIEDAIGLWGEILDKKPGDRKVKQALKRLRLSDDVEKFVEDSNPEDFLSMKPPFWVKLKPYITGISIVVAVIIFAAAFYVSPLYDRALKKFFPKVVELRSVKLPQQKEFVTQNGEKALYYFKNEELKHYFVKIKKYIYKNKVNRAIILLNKIMNSNALPQVKEKFKVLYNFIEPPNPLSIDYNPQYYEIIKDPVAFRGVYILWSGRVANLIKGRDFIEFDLLVNYIDEDTIAGIAHVKIPGKFFINNRMKVQIFGRYTGYDKKTGKLFIEGILLKRLEI